MNALVPVVEGAVGAAVGAAAESAVEASGRWARREFDTLFGSSGRSNSKRERHVGSLVPRAAPRSSNLRSLLVNKYNYKYTPMPYGRRRRRTYGRRRRPIRRRRRPIRRRSFRRPRRYRRGSRRPRGHRIQRFPLRPLPTQRHRIVKLRFHFSQTEAMSAGANPHAANIIVLSANNWRQPTHSSSHVPLGAPELEAQFSGGKATCIGSKIRWKCKAQTGIQDSYMYNHEIHPGMLIDDQVSSGVAYGSYNEAAFNARFNMTTMILQNPHKGFVKTVDFADCGNRVVYGSHKYSMKKYWGRDQYDGQILAPDTNHSTKEVYFVFYAFHIYEAASPTPTDYLFPEFMIDYIVLFEGRDVNDTAYATF